MNEVRWGHAPNGRLRGWVCVASDRIALRKCADLVQDTFGGEARDRVSGADLAFWDFMVGTALVTLQLERGVGVAVMANDDSAASTAVVRQIADALLAALRPTT